MPIIITALQKFTFVSGQLMKLAEERGDTSNEELFTDYMARPELQELVAKWLGSRFMIGLVVYRGGWLLVSNNSG